MEEQPSADPPVWFFVHLQKTGGTALTRRLRDHLGRRAVYPAAGDGDPVKAVLDPGHLADALAARRPEVRVVCGHFPLSVAAIVGPDTRTCTVLRHPVPRTISFLRHQRATDPTRADQTLAEIYDDADLQRRLVRNHMTKMLLLPLEVAQESGPLAPFAATLGHVDDALAALATVDVVGDHAHFEDFVDALGREAGWDLGAPVWANRSPVIDDGTDLDALAERIRVDNAVDVALYERFTATGPPRQTATGDGRVDGR